MTTDEIDALIDTTLNDLRTLQEQGNKEYSESANAFDNFERNGLALGLSKEQILMVYAGKHWDGINRYVRGHRSQREHVIGRIHDLMVYLVLLKGMILEGEKKLPAMGELADDIGGPG